MIEEWLSLEYKSVFLDGLRLVYIKLLCKGLVYV